MLWLAVYHRKPFSMVSLTLPAVLMCITCSSAFFRAWRPWRGHQRFLSTMHHTQRSMLSADRVVILVQAKGGVPEEVLATQVDPAAFEICGHIVLKRAQDYETVTQVGTRHLPRLAAPDGPCPVKWLGICDS